ncbi:MAG TPA: MMPL family transporter [Solirubrobacterales bacterium]
MLVSAVTGPRGRWVTVGVWLALALAGLLARLHIGDVTAAGQSSFLPADAQSTRALDALQRNFKGGDDVPVLVVFDRPGGLTGADLDAIGKVGEGLESLGLAGATPVFAPFSGEAKRPLGDVARVAHGVGPISRDGEAALVALGIDSNQRSAIVDGVERIRAYLSQHRRPGLHSYVTGPAGVAADLEHVADAAARTLLIATLGLVLVLLLLVYRAPPLALLPLLAVGVAYLIAIAIAYLLIEVGAIVVNAEGTMLLLVLIFGAGTDYSLLLIHRYREELSRGTEVEGALRAALTESLRPIGASAGTVIAAMLVLLLADLESTHWLGPILAIGIATMLAAALTLLPAALAILGRRAFWPGHAAEPGRRWARVAALVGRRPRTIVALVSAGLLVLALGNLIHHGTLGFGQGETGSSESGRGNEVLAQHFPPGIGSPLTAVVEDAQLELAIGRLETLDSVRLAVPVPPSGTSDEAAIAIVPRGDPYSAGAAEEVGEIREKLQEVAPSALVGGVPAENYDVERTNARDTRVIVPAVLIVVALILVGVLRALVAPAYLIVTVVASFAATLGLVTAAFATVLGSGGLSFDLVLLAFIFLVALGVDYNIFLMTRAREEAARLGTRDGVLSALESTGGVVTGAGVILAGTFATLTLLPLEELVQIGATVAIGVLLDTFVVRALLTPAITWLCGERAWWPWGSAGESAERLADAG